MPCNSQPCGRAASCQHDAQRCPEIPLTIAFPFERFLAAEVRQVSTPIDRALVLDAQDAEPWAGEFHLQLAAGSQPLLGRRSSDRTWPRLKWGRHADDNHLTRERVAKSRINGRGDSRLPRRTWALPYQSGILV